MRAHHEDRLVFLPGIALIAVLALTYLGSSGCSSGGGGGETETAEPCATSSFAADGGVPGSDSFSLALVETDGNLLTVSLEARGLSEAVYGLAAELVYDPAVFQYVSYAEGSFFSGPPPGQGGQEVLAALQSGRQGRVFVGASRLGNLAGVTGSGRVLELTLSGRTRGSSDLQWEGFLARDSDLGRLAGISTLGGTASCVP